MRESKHVAQLGRYRRNLRKLYRSATDADKREGLSWYPTAVVACEKWAQGFGVDSRTVACTIAAISPQCDWASNLRIAFELLSGQTTVTGGALRSNVDKARRILDDNATSVAAYFVSAPKVTAFSLNLMGRTDAVTIDTHAAQAAANDPTLFKGIPQNVYSLYASCYVDVAREFNVAPCDLQAIVWCSWKRRYPRAQKNKLVREKRAAA